MLICIPQSGAWASVQIAAPGFGPPSPTLPFTGGAGARFIWDMFLISDFSRGFCSVPTCCVSGPCPAQPGLYRLAAGDKGLQVAGLARNVCAGKPLRIAECRPVELAARFQAQGLADDASRSVARKQRTVA